jgi:hypothetical protein
MLSGVNEILNCFAVRVFTSMQEKAPTSGILVNFPCFWRFILTSAVDCLNRENYLTLL